MRLCLCLHCKWGRRGGIDYGPGRFSFTAVDSEVVGLDCAERL